MKTDSNLDSHNASFTAASGPTLLTDDEIAAVGGGVLDHEIPYIQAVAGTVGFVGGGVAAYAIVTGVVLATAPVGIAFAAAMGCVVIGGAFGVLAWEGITHMSN